MLYKIFIFIMIMVVFGTINSSYIKFETTTNKKNEDTFEMKNIDKKKVEINIYSYETDTIVDSLENEEFQEKILEILSDLDDWIVIQNMPEDLKEKAALIICQEKTRLLGERESSPREYEEVGRFIFYENSSFVGMLIAQDIVKNMYLPYALRYTLYKIPDEQLDILKDYISNIK